MGKRSPRVVVVISGGPFSGKSSLLGWLRRHLKEINSRVQVCYAGAGDEVRLAIKEGRLSMEELKQCLAGYKLSDTRAYTLMKVALEREVVRASDVLVLDGFPRCRSQLEGYRGLINACGLAPDKHMMFDLVLQNDEVARARFEGRKRQENRPDDDLNVLNNRLRIWGEDRSGLRTGWTHRHGNLFDVNADQPKERVQQDFWTQVSGLFN